MSTPGTAARSLAFLALAALAACGSAPTPPDRRAAPAQVPAGFPAEFYERAAARGDNVQRVDPAGSLVTLTVGRAGSLARLGHDHVIASRSVQGYVAPGLGRADLYVPLAELTVDEAALRAQAGLATQPTDADIEGTRSNMRDKVLQVQAFPYALVRVRNVEPQALSPGRTQAFVSVTLLGITRTSTVPLDLDTTPEETTARGTLQLKQSDFGIAPFSLFGGALQVKDEVEVRFELRARKAIYPAPITVIFPSRSSMASATREKSALPSA
ncbi:MAG: YceI family protein [Variovorax sp.]|nr:YceI family protein [Variovorax sp.]